VAGGVFRSRFKGPKRESRGGIFHRYPPHEPAQAIVLACILRHVGATHDDIAHRKLPRWYEPSFYYRTPRCGPHDPESLSTAILSPTAFEKGIVASPRNFTRGDVYPKPRARNVKIASRVHRSEYSTMSRFNPARILQNA